MSKSNIKKCAIIVAAGSGERTKLSYNKVLHYIGAKTVLEMTLDRFAEAGFDYIVCAHSERDGKAIREILSAYPNAAAVLGGSTRTHSVRNALAAIPSDAGVVAIHDGARPFVSQSIIGNAVQSALDYGSGIVCVPCIDAVKIVSGSSVISQPQKSTAYLAQTPQVFRADLILDAYNRISGDFGDDCEVFTKAGYEARIVIGDYANYKITTAEDIFKLNGSVDTAALNGNTNIAALNGNTNIAAGANSNDAVRIGAGFDVHALAPNRKLVLGGVTIPHPKGLLGHSDADVLTHAVMDALLSASGLPDIGVLFPDTSADYKDADSILLLKSVIKAIAEKGCRIGNISAVIMAEAPKLSPHILSMRESLSAAMGISLNQINISATTTEKLGIVGEGKGIAASCSCILFLRGTN